MTRVIHCDPWFPVDSDSTNTEGHVTPAVANFYMKKKSVPPFHSVTLSYWTVESHLEYDDSFRCRWPVSPDLTVSDRDLCLPTTPLCAISYASTGSRASDDRGRGEGFSNHEGPGLSLLLNNLGDDPSFLRCSTTTRTCVDSWFTRRYSDRTLQKSWFKDFRKDTVLSYVVFSIGGGRERRSFDYLC